MSSASYCTSTVRWPTRYFRENSLIFNYSYTCAGPDGGTGGLDPPLENYKNIGFLSNTGPDPLKITKLPSQHSILGNHRPVTERSFCGN